MGIEREQKLYDALSRIARYESPERLHKTGPKQYGLSGPEAIEAAYDNVRAEAKAAIKGMKRPNDATQNKT